MCWSTLLNSIYFWVNLRKFLFLAIFWQILPLPSVKIMRDTQNFWENLSFVKLYTGIMIIVQFVLLWRSSKETFFWNFSQFSTPTYPLKMTLRKKSDAMQSCGNFPVNFKKPKWVCSSYFRKYLNSTLF